MRTTRGSDKGKQEQKGGAVVAFAVVHVSTNAVGELSDVWLVKPSLPLPKVKHKIEKALVAAGALPFGRLSRLVDSAWARSHPTGLIRVVTPAC